MAAGPIGRGQPPPLPPRKKLTQNRPPLPLPGISVAVKNRETGEWETPNLGEKEKKSLDTALNVLVNCGAAKQGTHVRLSEEGLFAQEGHEWKNLLEGAPPGVQETFQKIYESVSPVLGQPVNQPDAATLHTFLRDFPLLHQATHSYFNPLLSRLEELQKAVKEGRLGKEWSSTRKEKLIERCEAVIRCSRNIVIELNGVKDKLRQGDTEGALRRFFSEIPALYAALGEAMIAWSKEQQFVDNVFGIPRNPFSVNVQNLSVQMDMVKNFLQILPSPIENSWMANTRMFFITTSFTNALHLEVFTKKKIEALHKQEKFFNAEIKKILAVKGDAGFIDALAREGVPKDEASKYCANLEELVKKSDRFLAGLEHIQELFLNGSIQEGMDLYSAHMKEHYATYIEECEVLILHQSKVQRYITGPLQSFYRLDLSHISDYETALREIREETRKMRIQNAQLEETVNVRDWEAALVDMRERAGAFSKKLAPLQLEQTIFLSDLRNTELAQKLGAFVSKYENQRKLFEQVMRKQGVSAEEAAFIFNHYKMIYTALTTWNEQFIEVVKHINNKHYDEALQSLTKMVAQSGGDFDKIRGDSAFTAQIINTPAVQKGLEEFARWTKLEKPDQLSKTLNTRYLLNDFQFLIEECEKYATTVEPYLKKGVHNALIKVQDAVRKSEIDSALYQKLTRADRLINFFNFEDLQLHPRYSSTWNKILKKYGWSLSTIQKYSSYINYFTDSVKLLKKLALASKSENDPKRRFEWAKNIYRLSAELESAYQEFNALGGFNRLETIRSAAEEMAKVGGLEQSMTVRLREEANRLATSISDLTTERIAYLDRTLADCGIYPQEWEFGYVDRHLLQRLQTSDSDYHRALETKGWSVDKIKKYSDIYNFLVKESLSLYRAKTAYESNPKDAAAKRKYQETARKQMPKLKTYLAQFSALVEQSGQVPDLMEALETYKRVLQQRLPHLIGAADRYRTKDTIDMIGSFQPSTFTVGLKKIMDEVERFTQTASKKSSPKFFK